jgi:hypothetical protein
LDGASFPLKNRAVSGDNRACVILPRSHWDAERIGRKRLTSATETRRHRGSQRKAKDIFRIKPSSGIVVLLFALHLVFSVSLGLCGRF